jgi:hypothetical protein
MMRAAVSAPAAFHHDVLPRTDLVRALHHQFIGERQVALVGLEKGLDDAEDVMGQSARRCPAVPKGRIQVGIGNLRCIAQRSGQDEVEARRKNLGGKRSIVVRIEAEKRADIGKALRVDPAAIARDHRHASCAERAKAVHRLRLCGRVDRQEGHAAAAQELLDPQATGASWRPVHADVVAVAAC